MENGNTVNTNLDLAKKCLALISKIAARGAVAQNPEHVGYALQELSQVLFERTGSEDRAFEPVAADDLHNLDQTLLELKFVNGCAQDMAGGGGFMPLPILPVQLS